MDINEIKKEIKEQVDYLTSAEDEQQATKDDYSESYVKAMRKRDEAQQRGDSEGVAKAEHEADFWLDSMCDSDYEMSLLELEYDGVEKVAHAHGLMINDYGDVVDDPYPYDYTDDIDGTVADLFGDFKEDTNHASNDYTEDDVADLFGDAREVKNND